MTELVRYNLDFLTRAVQPDILLIMDNTGTVKRSRSVLFRLSGVGHDDSDINTRILSFSTPTRVMQAAIYLASSSLFFL